MDLLKQEKKQEQGNNNDKILYKEEKYINSINFPLLFEELGKIGYSHFQLKHKNNKFKSRIIKSKYYKNIKEEDLNDVKSEEKDRQKTMYTDRYKQNDKIHKIIEQLKNKNNEEQINKRIPLINEVI